MVTVKQLRQVLKVLAEDTRLRIINLLGKRELTVSSICDILEISQPTVSKHLVRLRLLKVVKDKRVGNFVYYRLNLESDQNQIIKFILKNFGNLEKFQKDFKALVLHEKKSSKG